MISYTKFSKLFNIENKQKEKLYNLISKLEESDKNRIIYQILYEFSQANQANQATQKNVLIKSITEKLENNKYCFNHSCYDNARFLINEQDEYLTNPFVVEEGVVECPKCNSKKCWSVQKQIRSADEPMTTISRCMVCSYNWTYAG